MVEIALDNERRIRNEVDSDGVGDSDTAEGGDFLADTCADAEGGGGVTEEVGGLEVGEEEGEDVDLAVPIAGGPEVAELGVESFVELAVDVGGVGGVSWSDSDAGGGCGGGGGGGVEREEEEEGEGEEERECEVAEDDGGGGGGSLHLVADWLFFGGGGGERGSWEEVVEEKRRGK